MIKYTLDSNPIMQWKPIKEFDNTNGDYLLWIAVDQGYWFEAMFCSNAWHDEKGEPLKPYHLQNITHYLIIENPSI